jgi:hypothetical protein
VPPSSSDSWSQSTTQWRNVQSSWSSAEAHGLTSVTSDIDTFGRAVGATNNIHEAAQTAGAETGLDIPIADSTIAQFPDGFEGRLLRVMPELEHLELWVPDVYDLAAAKLLRGNDHDRQQLAELHHLAPLDRATLVGRFNALLAHYVGDPVEPRWSLFHLVTELWGEIAALDLRPRGPG